VKESGREKNNSETTELSSYEKGRGKGETGRRRRSLGQGALIRKRKKALTDGSGRRVVDTFSGRKKRGVSK